MDPPRSGKSLNKIFFSHKKRGKRMGGGEQGGYPLQRVETRLGGQPLRKSAVHVVLFSVMCIARKRGVHPPPTNALSLETSMIRPNPQGVV